MTLVVLPIDRLGILDYINVAYVRGRVGREGGLGIWERGRNFEYTNVAYGREGARYIEYMNIMYRREGLRQGRKDFEWMTGTFQTLLHSWL